MWGGTPHASTPIVASASTPTVASTDGVSRVRAELRQAVSSPRGAGDEPRFISCSGALPSAPCVECVSQCCVVSARGDENEKKTVLAVGFSIKLQKQKKAALQHPYRSDPRGIPRPRGHSVRSL